MPPRRASKRARPDEEDEQQQQQQQQPEQQLERRASARRAAVAAPAADVAAAADAPSPAVAANTSDDNDNDPLATERASDPTGFAGLGSEEEEEEGDAAEQPAPSSRRRGAGAAAAAAAAANNEQQERRTTTTKKKLKATRRARRSATPAAVAEDEAVVAQTAPAAPPAPTPPPPPPPKKKLSPLALTLYVRWWAPDGLKTRVHEIPLRSLGSADDLRGLPRELVRRLFGVPPSVPADASIAPHLPPHAAGPDFYRFTPAGGREFLSVPGPIAAFEVRLVVAAGGWEHTIADRGGGGLGGPGDVVVAVTEFESPPVDLGPGAMAGFPRALLPMLRLPLIAYPLVCVRRSFLDRVERMLTTTGGSGGVGAGVAGAEAAAAAGGPTAAAPANAAAPFMAARHHPHRPLILPEQRIVPGKQPPLPGADHPGAGAVGVGAPVAFSADAVATFDGRCAAGVAASLGRPDGGRGLGTDAAVVRERAAAVRPIVPL